MPTVETYPVEVAAPEDPVVLACDVATLDAECLLVSAGDLRVYLARAEQMPAVLREIGRLRELTFRAAGEGTGKTSDLDRFDAEYLHLFVWNAATWEVVGGYRLAKTDQVRDGLYTSTLFQYDERFLARLGPAVELGRSFIRAEYQRAFAPLLLLWKGIGRFVARNPRYRVLFGPVSISARYQSISRDLMVSFLDARETLSDWVDLVCGRNPPQRSGGAPQCRDIDALSKMVADLEPDGAGVPVLLRQYLRMGGKLLGFNVDPAFSNALDGLILVDLTRAERRLLERYLGHEEAAQFLEYQERVHGAH